MNFEAEFEFTELMLLYLIGGFGSLFRGEPPVGSMSQGSGA